MKDKFDYGDYVIEYREKQNGVLFFLKKRITNVDDALKESNKLKDNGYHDVLIKKRK